MIRGSALVAVMAALLSILVHGLGLGVTSRQDQPSAIDEGAADLADVGSAFEDFAAMIPEPEAPEPAQAPDPPEVTPPEQTTDEVSTSQALVASDNPQDVTAPDTGSGDVIEPDAAELSDSEAPPPDTAERSGGEDDAVADVTVSEPVAPDPAVTAADAMPEEPPEPAMAEAPEPTPESEPVTSAETVPPLASDPSPDAASILEPDRLDPDQPDMTAALTPTEPETVTAEDPEDGSSAAVTRSLRPPKERPLRLVLGRPDAARQQGAQTGRATGTIESPLTSYKRTGIDPFAGSSAARTTASGFAGSRNPGNASTTNYAGRVLVQLNRFRSAGASARGAAQVSFEINPDGTVAWVAILRSTGSPDIRRLAAAQIRRAAPFPPPPEGTSQRLVFTYQGR